MKNKTALLGTMLLFTVALHGCATDTPGDAVTDITAAATAMKPTSDVSKQSVVGVGDATNLYLDVNDGTAFASADDNTTYVRGQAAVASSSHEVGYSGGPSGTVTQVTVN